jgi:hypothetical protein
MNRRIWSCLLAGSVACGLIGCGGPSAQYKPADQLPPAHDHGHGHSEEGPHHGSLVELGDDEFHAEIVVDGKAHSLKLYLLGPDAKTAASTPATEAVITLEDGPTLTLKAVEGQPEGMNTVFEVVDEEAVHEIAEAEFIHGSLKITVGEKEYSVGLDVHFHADHDHDHDHEHGAKPEKPVEPSEPAEPAQPE